ncbi:MAG: nitroreductase family protein [Verrucomicrobiota bacterium]|nr:nitroreductase family protein [Verrucomicrobiota bacterium]
MDTLTAIETRRAVKHFDPSHKLTDSEIEQLLSHAILAPTAFNIQHWRFVVVKDVAIRQAIRAAAWGQAQVTDASLLLVVTADSKAWLKQPERYWANAPKEVQGFMVPAIHGYYKDSEQTQRDEAMRSMGIAAQTIMLTARAMGYDSCPMDGFDFGAVGKIINLPADHVIGLMIAVGKATTPARPRGGQLPLSEVVITDKFA